jgi:CDGSH-type Zn-finger protein
MNTMNEYQPKIQTEFTFKPGGSLKVKGNFILKDSQGNIIETSGAIKLCRCGLTKNQPFCDNTHRKE